MDDMWPLAHQLLFMFPGAMGNIMLLTINYKTENDCVIKKTSRFLEHKIVSLGISHEMLFDFDLNGVLC